MLKLSQNENLHNFHKVQKFAANYSSKQDFQIILSL